MIQCIVGSEVDIRMYSIDDISNFYLSKKSMSPKKLQKILYYAYSWTLAIFNDCVEELDFKLFNEPIEAWVHGPVVPCIYQKYKSYGWGDIPKSTMCNNYTIPNEIVEILDQVWDVYGEFSGNQLEAFTHSETPWIIARIGCSLTSPSHNVISDIEIFKYYNKRLQDE